MQIDSIKMQDLREKTPSKRRGNKICLGKKGKTDGEEGRKLWSAEKFHTVEIYLTQREARLRGQSSIRLDMKPEEAWAPPGGL